MRLKRMQENVRERFGDVHGNVRQRIEEMRIPKHFVMNRIIVLLLVVLLILQGIFLLDQRGYVTLPQSFLVVAKAIVLVTLSFVIVSAFIRITERAFSRILGKDVEPEQRIFFTKIYAFTLYLGTIAFILYKLGASAENITLVLGLVATGVALAIRDWLASLMVWFMLLLKKPFRIGDYIRIGEDAGKVLHVGTFYVILDCDEAVDTEIMRVPNTVFLQKNVQNLGKEGVFMDTTRIPMRGVPDAESLEELRAAAQEMLKVKQHVYVNLDAEKEWNYVVVRYPVRFSDRDEARTRVMLLARKALGMKQTA